MARPRVFVSSTYYDLKHLRSSLDLFIESLGYDSILSEKGDIAYTPDRPLDESCYREAEGADIFVLIIGGRYGSEASSGSKKPSRTFFDRYDSITRKEYESAVTRDIPVYILIESGVYLEYQTFLRNKDNKLINYAHVDSVNIFHLIEEILARPRNNPVRAFERFSDIEGWLREQWAGLFRDLLHRQSQQQQFTALSVQVSGLKEINETLKKYLEAVMTGVSPDASTKLIASEEQRLEELKRDMLLRDNPWTKHILTECKIPFEKYVTALRESTSIDNFANSVSQHSTDPELFNQILHTLSIYEDARTDLDKARILLNLPPLSTQNIVRNEHLTKRSTGRAKKRTPVSS